MKTALSLYVAIAVHLLILLGLVLGSGSGSQLPFGVGNGLGDGKSEQAAPLASEADKPAAASPSQQQPQQNPSPERIADRLGLASKPVQLGRPAASEATPQTSAGISSAPRTNQSGAPIAAGAFARSGGSAGGGRGGYLADLRRHLDRHRRSLPGVLASARSEVAFTVAADGGVSALRLQKSSGVAALDQEALALLRRAAPLPKPPDGLTRELIVPVSVGAPRP
ncbi:MULTISPECIES: TonB family protein [Hydrocarboniphaga]|uniref:TonB C-terminal domain-containing protein n=1 Tax=Hydrocarboniphaga effusa AP103 TaxID=1172194 RepID=I7ZAW9_9GAMM|nr:MULTISPECIES: TonB family protein [Hydrocarboniphaga]EIT68822.1 hypothetical protein WQQ_24040 [Hydrocarboniphaga effusa AP103]MDZ4077681.1 TonB family protein [Hydrocarboniphaga sp.]